MSEYGPPQKQLPKRRWACFGYSRLWRPIGTNPGSQEKNLLGHVVAETMVDAYGKARLKWDVDLDYVRPEGFFEEHAPKTLSRTVEGDLKPRDKVVRRR